MSRQPSEATQLRKLNAELKCYREQVARLQAESKTFLGRALTAEVEARDWKRRFDLLLEHTLKEPKP